MGNFLLNFYHLSRCTSLVAVLDEPELL